MTLEDALAFRRYITPPLVMLIYLIGAICITIIAFLEIYQGSQIPCFIGICLSGLYYLSGIITLVFGNLFWRLICEYIVVQFRIYDAIRSIDSKIGPSAQSREGPRLSTEVRYGGGKCQNCGTANRDTAKFCRSCGLSLEADKSRADLDEPKHCDQCSAVNDPQNKYCEKCGSKLY